MGTQATVTSQSASEAEIEREILSILRQGEAVSMRPPSAARAREMAIHNLENLRDLEATERRWPESIR